MELFKSAEMRMKGVDIMLYSFGKLKVITRGKSKSAVATAAYHSASKIKNEWDGVTHDYSNKKNVGATFICMPENAPDRYKDESVPVQERLGMIWNDVEHFEKNLNAQLARQNYLALQNEFTLEQNLECVNRFIKENCTSVGMGAIYSVHNKPGNQHVDIMYLMRQFDKDGNFEAKCRKEYLCRNRNGDEKYLSTDEFKKEKENGWEKIYKYRKGNSWKKLTKSEAEKEEFAGYKRVSKHPLDRKIEVNTWNDKELVSKWRKSWEVILNEKFEELGMKNRVDCRSYAEINMGLLPTVHEGWGKTKDEKRAYNKQIKEYNKEIKGLFWDGRAAVDDIKEQARDLRDNQQTEMSLQDHEERYEVNKSKLEAISESNLLGESVSKRFKAELERLSNYVHEWIDKWKNKLKTEIRGYSDVMEPAGKVEQSISNVKDSLDDIIANALPGRVKKFPKEHKKVHGDLDRS